MARSRMYLLVCSLQCLQHSIAAAIQQSYYWFLHHAVPVLDSDIWWHNILGHCKAKPAIDCGDTGLLLLFILCSDCYTNSGLWAFRYKRRKGQFRSALNDPAPWEQVESSCKLGIVHYRHGNHQRLQILFRSLTFINVWWIINKGHGAGPAGYCERK